MSTVYLGADHRGIHLKEKLAGWLMEWGHNVIVVGKEEYDPEDDFTDIAFELGEKVSKDKAKGILICGSGVGVCMAVNKVKGIRAGQGLSEKQIMDAREDDDINVLCLASDWVDEEANEKIARAFLDTIFSSEERYIRRLNKIKEYESKTG